MTEFPQWRQFDEIASVALLPRNDAENSRILKKKKKKKKKKTPLTPEILEFPRIKSRIPQT